jgi:sialidase-1
MKVDRFSFSNVESVVSSSGMAVPRGNDRSHPRYLPQSRTYFTLRTGLHNTAARLAEKNGAATVAFLGGSITASNGWRDDVERRLTERFPHTRFTFVRAGIPSLGSVPHAFRLERDVLSAGRIDLCFVEAAVNDPTNFTPPERMVRGMEGVVRHLRRVNPRGDIVHLHFAMPEHLADYRSGKTPEVIRQHERVAARYGNPSLDLAREVTERIAAGEFDWDRDFKDLHPAPFGHRLYADSIARLLDAALRPPTRAPEPHPMPRPVDTRCYDAGHLVSPDAATARQDFTLEPRWHPGDGRGTRPGFVDVPALVGATPGASFEYRFTGTAVGLFVASGPDAGRLDYTVDGRAYPTQETFTPWSSGLHLPWALVLADGLRPGDHVLRVRLAADHHAKSTGTALRVIHFMENRAV